MGEVLLQEQEGSDPAATGPQPVPAPSFLVELPSWPRVFFANLGDLVVPRRLPPLELHSDPARFWPDVFVKRGLPWRRFLESGGYHTLALGLLITLSRFLALHPQSLPSSGFDHAQVIYYQPAEYLPPLDTRSSNAAQPQKADPEFSRQPIISVPPEFDNHSQTIVSPPKIKLQHDVPLPNIVAWSDQPQLPIAPAPLVPASSLTRLTPQIENSVVAPPPDVRTSTATTAFQAPQPAIIAPPPSVQNSSTRQLGDLNIGHSSIIAPAPQLPVSEQRAMPGGISAAASVAPQVVPPPPSLSGSGSSAAAGRIIALNLHHAVAGDPASRNSTGSAPVNSKLMASLPPPRVTRLPARPPQSEGETKLSEAERAVFGDRQFYSLTLNMPNLNSAGGSWVIRFAELKHDSTADSKQQLSAPAATRKVDPAYPLQLMRENVEGVVTLYAVIRSDGTVGYVRVLNGIDSRLDQFASQAVSQWQFHPAMKNGAPVDVEATFRIPFRPQRRNF